MTEYMELLVIIQEHWAIILIVLVAGIFWLSSPPKP